MRILGVVTARGGSKGVPKKNIRLLAGKPMIVWTIEAARAAQRISRLVLTTDDEEIAAAGRSAGIEVPFLRPAELAMDTTPTLPVLQHAVAELEQRGDHFDAVCLLQPTNPLRTSTMIDGAIEAFTASGADSLISVLSVPHEYNPHWVYFKSSSGDLELSTGEAVPIPRRQDLPPAFHRDGSIYLMRRDVLMLQGTMYGARVVGYEIDEASSINIDTPDDFARAASLMMGR